MVQPLYIHIKLDGDGKWGSNVTPRELMHVLHGGAYNLLHRDGINVVSVCTTSPTMRDFPVEAPAQEETVVYVDGDQVIREGISTLTVGDGSPIEVDYAQNHGINVRDTQQSEDEVAEVVEAVEWRVIGFNAEGRPLKRSPYPLHSRIEAMGRATTYLLECDTVQIQTRHVTDWSAGIEVKR